MKFTYVIHPESEDELDFSWRKWFRSQTSCLAALLAAALLVTVPFFYLRPRRTLDSPAQPQE